MSKVKVRSYLSPTLVLLAMDWDEGSGDNDFLGFAIKRKPGFRPKKGAPQSASDWLPNRRQHRGGEGDTFTLTTDASWAKKDYSPGTMEYVARMAFAG